MRHNVAKNGQDILLSGTRFYHSGLSLVVLSTCVHVYVIHKIKKSQHAHKKKMYVHVNEAIG